ncbi:MAG: prolyl oligopeptidase family serine peptidase [Woeseiaceae bacterium]|nr:prolyl oligopeptidase family serine peptidase [Woeseiaceae bacterium]
MLYLPGIPGRELLAAPDTVGLSYENVTLEASDGVSVHGWFVPGESQQVLLYFHGNAGNISHRLYSIKEFHDLGLSVFIIDYRGYGQSDGKPTEQGLYRDGEAAWRYLTGDRGIVAQNIILFGRSLGGSVASWLAAREQPAALIVESSFTSVPDIGQEAYPWLPVRLLSRFRHSTLDQVTKVACPVLVVHSRDDEIIPFHHGKEIFSAANEPKTFLEIRGGHNDGHAMSATVYRNGIKDFLDSL